MARSNDGLAKALVGGVVVVALFLVVPSILLKYQGDKSRKSVGGFASLFSRMNSWFGDPRESAELGYLLSSGNTVGQAAASVEEDPRDVISALTGVNVSGPIEVVDEEVADQIPY